MAKLAMTTEEFIDKIRQIHGDKYDYSLVEYNGYDSKVKVKCNTCGNIFEIKAGYLLKGKGCPYCKYHVSDGELKSIAQIPINEKTKEFIKKARKIHDNIYSYKYTRYEKLKSKVVIKCNICGRYFKQYPQDHLNGHGCPYCGIQKRKLKQSMTKEEFIEKARKIHGDKYDYSLVEYKTIRDKVKIKCNNCGCIFEQIPAYHLRGSGCPHCANKNKLTHEEFVKRIRNIYGENNIEILTTYKSYKDIVKVKCLKHNHIVETKAEYLLKGSKFCRICMLEEGKFRGVKLTKEEFIRRAKKVHGDKYDYGLVEYKTFNEKVKIKCKTCGKIFETYPIAHLKGSICPHCNINNMRLSKEELLSRIESIYGKNSFEINYNDYRNISTQITVKCNKCGNKFTVIPELFLQGTGCPYCNRSSFELQVYNYLKSIGIQDDQILINQRKILDNYEIDIYLPKYKLGIECHGMYWHTINKYNKDKWQRLKELHKIKADLADKCNIQLLQIFEYEWYDSIKQNIWKNIINVKLGLVENKISARKCKVISLTNKEAKEFLDKYHLHGYVNASFNYGLVFNDEIVAVATFGKHRFNKSENNTKNIYELYRFASKSNTIVLGGFSKLMKHFFRIIKPKLLITYADRRYSSIKNNVYKKVGFKYIGITKPNYRYLKFEQNRTIVLNRLNFQKHMLEKKLSYYNEFLTEQENMLHNNYHIIYDAGNYIFQL